MFSGKIAVNLGFTCNFACVHCANAFEKRKRLSPEEKRNITSAIRNLRARTLHFIGGEPTLYLKDIAEIVRSSEARRSPSVIIATNGWFAKSKSAAAEMLARIPGLVKVLLSYDKFHARFLPFVNIGYLYEACVGRGVDFGVLCSIETPADILLINKVKGIGRFPVLIQKVLPQGSAKKRHVEYKNYPGFDKKVLRRKCPSRKDLVYICGKGFSVCCSSLVFNPGMTGVCYKTQEALVKSEFYRLISDKNFSELLSLSGAGREELRPEHSSICNLCDYLMRKPPLKRMLNGS